MSQTEITKSDVEFASGSLKLAGNLYLPADAQTEGRKLPAILLVTPCGGIKEQTAGLYAQLLSKHGFVTLAFDNSSFGESEGSPRFNEDGFVKVEDIKNAVTFLGTRPEVDPNRIGAVGICGAGAYVPFAAATERKIRAVATVSGLHDLARTIRDGFGPQLTGTLEAGGAARQAYAAGAEPAYIPVFPTGFVSDGTDYYMNPARGNHKRWDNKILLWSFEKLASFSALPLVEMISPHPVLFIAGTKADSKSHSEIAFEKAKEPKELYWIEGASHFDLYDGPEYTKQVATKLANFFTEHIGGSH
jgi:fermentation-respiration switch protein FrsA (DUF1100 family)